MCGQACSNKGRCWHQSVSPGTYPSWQRGFASEQSQLANAASAASASHSGKLQGVRAARSARTKGATLVLARLGWHLSVRPTLLRSYRCAVSRDERHCAASKEVWGTSAEHSGETQRHASPPLRGFVSSGEQEG